MIELFETCPKIQFFKKPFWCFLRFKGDEFGHKRCKMWRSDASGTINDHFATFSPIFQRVSPKNLTLPPTLKLHF